MKSLRDAIDVSWIPQMRIINANLAVALGLPTPLSVRDLIRLLGHVQEIKVSAALDRTALHGKAEVILRSDGTYEFSGNLEATGFPSFDCKLQALVHASADIVIAMQSAGTAYGTDTPGNRTWSWVESGQSEHLRTYWMALRIKAELETRIETDLAGVTGLLADVGKIALESFVAGLALGPVGSVLVLGSNLGAATGITYSNPNILIGVAFVGAAAIIFGPVALIPAAIAFVSNEDLHVSYRSMTAQEVELANRIFQDTLPIDRIRITNLYVPGKNGLAREFVAPAIDGSILVNMGKNFNHTLEPDVQGRVQYSRPGEVLAHELTHAWQIHHATFVAGFICSAMLNRDYIYDLNHVKQHAVWSSFGIEQQASIVDDWYGDHCTDLNSHAALNNPRFFYIAGHIRIGRT